MTTLAWLRLPFRKWNTNEAITSADLQRVATFGLTAVLDGLVSRLVLPHDQATPDSGWWGHVDCVPEKGTNPLDVDVLFGAGLCYSSALTSSHDLPALQPVIVASSSTKTLDAHDATHPRIDRIDVVPGWSDADNGTRRIRPAGPGSQTTSTLYRRRDAIGTVTVTKGTPGASPATPSAPSSSIPVALVYVPAVSGDVTVTDIRRFIRPAAGREAIPDPGVPGSAYTTGVPYARSVVQSGCAVSAGTGLTVDVDNGTLDHLGARCKVAAKTLTIATADATHPRYDAVYVDADAAGTPNSRPGALTLAVVTGTPAASPTVPTANTGSVILAYVYVAAGATSLSIGNIYDVRPLAPYTNAKQATRTVNPTVSIADLTGGIYAVSVQSADDDGVAVATDKVVYECELLSSTRAAVATDTIAYLDVTTGSSLMGSDGLSANQSLRVFRPNGSGALVFTVVNNTGSALDLWLRITPARYVNTNSLPSTLDSATGRSPRGYVPGAPVWVKVTFT